MGIDVPNGTHADLQERNDRNDRGVRERAGTPGGKPFFAPSFPSSKGFRKASPGLLSYLRICYKLGAQPNRTT